MDSFKQTRIILIYILRSCQAWGFKLGDVLRPCGPCVWLGSALSGDFVIPVCLESVA